MKTIFNTILILLLLSCADSSSNDDGTPIGGLDFGKAGADEFSKGNYEKAIQRFEAAIKSAKTNEEKSKHTASLAYSKMRHFSFNTAKYAEIMNNFNASLSLNSQNIDAKCGKLILHYVYDNNYSSMLGLANDILNESSSYQLELDKSINHFDVKVMKALAEYQLEQYDNAVSTINTITSFTVSGMSGDEKVLAIAEKLEALILTYKN